jgi:hypothetical protein
MDEKDLEEALDAAETLWWACVNEGLHGRNITEAGKVLVKHGRLSEQNFREQTTYSK